MQAHSSLGRVYSRSFWHGIASFVACLTCLSSGAQSQSRGGAALGTLFTAGPLVSVNGQIVANGTPIGSGDTVVTGAASSAFLSLSGGGSVQLDQNTQSSLYAQARDAIGCALRIVIPVGQNYVEGHGLCGDGGGVAFAANSQLNLRIVAGGAVLTVTEGNVVLSAAQRVSITAGTQVSVIGGRINEQHRITPAEQEAIVGWRGQYVFGAASGAPQPTYSQPPPYYNSAPTYYPAPAYPYYRLPTYRPPAYYDDRQRYNPRPRYPTRDSVPQYPSPSEKPKCPAGVRTVNCTP
jgi:hypothetical protein